MSVICPTVTFLAPISVGSYVYWTAKATLILNDMTVPAGWYTHGTVTAVRTDAVFGNWIATGEGWVPNDYITRVE